MRVLKTKLIYCLLVAVFLLAACGEESITPVPSPTVQPQPTPPPPFTISPLYHVTTLPYSFNSPTQFVVQPDVLWVAELNGGENAESGRVLRVDQLIGEQAVIVEGLNKPTGIAVLDDELYVATRNQLLKYTILGENKTILLDNLPNNGRSNGTLTVTPEGNLLYETSGNRSDAASGKLWEYDVETGETRVLASGLKGAYAHVFDETGRLWTTEIADGSLNGTTLPDELNLVIEGADFGWPRCYGRELVGECEGVRPAVVTFDARSTPTGIAVFPSSVDSFLVALWVTGEVVQVPIFDAGDNAVGEIVPFITDMQNPQHIVVVDGDLYVSDFATGEIYLIVSKR